MAEARNRSPSPPTEPDDDVDIQLSFNFDAKSDVEEQGSVHGESDIDVEDEGTCNKDEATSSQADTTDEPVASSSKSKKKTSSRQQNKAGKFGKLPKKLSEFYLSRANLADLFELTSIEMDELLLEDPEIAEISADYISRYYDPLKKAAEEAGKDTRARDSDVNKFIDILLAADKSGEKTYASPSRTEQKTWEPKDWLLRSIYRYKEELERHKILAPIKKVSAKNAYLWAYVLLKTKEVLHRTPEKERKAVNALKKARVAVRKRQRDLVAKEKTQKAKYSSTVPIAASIQAKTSAKSQKKAKAKGSPGNSSLEGPPTTTSAEGSRSRTDKALELIKKREKRIQQELDAAMDDDDEMDRRILPDTTDDDIIQAFEHQRDAEEEAQRKRRERLELKAARDMFECLAKLKENASAGKSYQAIQRALRSATECFFADFQCVEVDEYKDKIMGAMPRANFTAGELSSNTLSAVAEEQKDETATSNDPVRNAVSVGENLTLQETATVTRTLESSSQSLKLEDVYTMDLPPPTKKDRIAAAQWNSMINGLEFQCGGLAKAMIRCYMSDAEVKRIPYQSLDKTLRWWQVVFIWWSNQVLVWARTKGGLDADTVGLGKTLSYGGYILVDMIDQLNAYEDAPENAKPACRPWMIQTLPGLVKQTTDDLRAFSSLFRIIVLHGDSAVVPSARVCVMGRIPNDHEVWDINNAKNLRTIIITSVNTANAQYGPTGFEAWKRSYDPHWKAPKEGFPTLDPKWPDNPQGRVRGIVLDEVQYGFRNDTAFAQTVRWFKAPIVWLFSGSPTPRGLQDWTSYLSLIELDDLAESAPYEDEECGYTSSINPYELANDHPAAKYQFTSFAFDKWIVNNKDLSDVEKGIAAQKVLRHFVLRRDYASACPLGSDRTIARNLPPLKHYSIERIFKPTDQDLYNKFYKQWARRLILQPEEGGTEDPVPNPRALRAVTLITTMPILGYLHRPNPQYRAPPRKGDPDYIPYEQRITQKKTAKNDQDWLSWFNEDSEFYRSMPKPGLNLQRWRWILNAIVQQGCKEIKNRPYNDRKAVTNAQVLETILNCSPKLQSLLSAVAEHAILRDEKILLWFHYPITQTLVMEILLNDSHLRKVSDTLSSATTQMRRGKLQEDINDPTSTLRVLGIAMGCGGIGLNFQEDSHICMLFEAPSNLDMELQVIGRQHRLGQLLAVLVYSLLMANTTDEAFVTKMLEKAVAGTAALMSHRGPVNEDMVDDEAMDFGTYLEGYFIFTTTDGKEHTLHINSSEGQEAIETLRRLNEVDDDWLPSTLAPSIALQRLLAQNRANVVRQHGGMGKGATSDLDWLVRAELEERKMVKLRKPIKKATLEKSAAEGEESGGSQDSPSPEPSAPKKVVVNAPDEHGIVYPTPDKYHAMTTAQKAQATRKINKERAAKGLSKWTPPAANKVKGDTEEETDQKKSKKRKVNEATGGDQDEPEEEEKRKEKEEKERKKDDVTGSGNEEKRKKKKGKEQEEEEEEDAGSDEVEMLGEEDESTSGHDKKRTKVAAKPLGKLSSIVDIGPLPKPKTTRKRKTGAKGGSGGNGARGGSSGRSKN
ncbi:hypothetical protein N0V94_008339 [Neodidymelliopsis sp. IMI 364377]|nr:hypothetical protein N0V94_008339 [Neodidymelliopsis sp. IMI 364377]